MQQINEYHSVKVLSNVFSQHLIGKKCCNISFDLNLYSIPSPFREIEATKLAIKFRNNLSRFYFGRAARDRKQFATTNVCFHKIPQFHFHIIAEIPKDTRFDAVRDFTNDFVLKNYPICIPRKKDKQLCYFQPTEDVLGSLIYNQRYGTDTCLLF